jgi:hypothetical protein
MNLGPLIKKLVFFQGLLLVARLATAEVTVDLRTSQTQITPDDRLVYSITISSSEEVQKSDITFSKRLNNEGIEVFGPQLSTGTQVHIINGSMTTTSQKTYQYQLTFQKPGTYSVKSPRILVNGKTFIVKDITVDVDVKYAQKQQNQNRPQDPFGLFDRFFKGFDMGGSGSHVRPPRKDDVQLIFQPSATEVLEGEPIWTKLIAYVDRNYRPQNLSPHFDLLSNSIFWMETLDQKAQVLTSVGPGNDVAYQLTEFVLFPLQSGSEYMDAITLEGDLVTGMKAYPFKAEAKPINFLVKPLPDPRPVMPLVSDELHVSFKVEKAKASVDQPIPFSMTITGIANLRLIDSLPITLPKHIDVVTQEDTLNIQKHKGYRFELQKSGYFIARKPGVYKLTTQPLTYYHPERKQYFQSEVDSIDLTVSGLLQPTLAQNKPSDSAQGASSQPTATTPFTFSGPFWLGLLGLMIIGCVGWGIGWSRKARQLSRQSTIQNEVYPLVVSFQKLVREKSTKPSEIFSFLEQNRLIPSGAKNIPDSAKNHPQAEFVWSLYETYMKSRFSGEIEDLTLSDIEKTHLIEVAEALVKQVVKHV